jgi:hypothetical protein
MDSVKWYVHCQGQMVGDTTGYHWDPSYHYYTTVVATGQRVHIGTQDYFAFNASTKIFQHDTVYESNTVYAREDTINKSVSSFCGSNYLSLKYTLDINDKVDEFYRWVGGNITSIDSFKLGKKDCKRWRCTTTGNKTYFYQAYGIGWQMGILPLSTKFCGNGGEVVSLDFVYKSDSVHIDFN